MTLRRTEDWLAEYEARNVRTSERKAQSSLLQYEAGRQKRRAAVEDKPTETESKIQQRGVAMAREAMQIAGYDPRLLFAIPNGADVSDGNRMRLVAEGMTAGVLDLFLSVPKMKYRYGELEVECGLYIEVKRPDGKLSNDQREMKRLFEANEYRTVICYSAEEIRDAVIDYLGIGTAV